MTLRDHLIEFLNSSPNDSLDSLGKQHIRVTSNPSYPGLYCLKYGPAADKTVPIVQACRGAIVEKVGQRFELKSYAFDRFFNHGENGAHSLNWGKTKVFHKYDGSLIQLFFHNGEWVVSTSGTVGASSLVQDTGVTFASLFWQAFGALGYSANSLDRGFCYVFELCHPLNRNVIEYAQPELPLLAVRDRGSRFKELPIGQFSDKFQVAKTYDFGDFPALYTELDRIGATSEGFVLYDGEGRLKVKSDDYVRLHTSLNNMNPNFSELFLSGELDEFTTHFPTFAKKFSPYLDRLCRLEKDSEEFLRAHSSLSPKEFALEVQKHGKGLSTICFGLRSSGSTSFREWVFGQRPTTLDKLLMVK